MKTSELTGPALDWAVAKANNIGHPWRYYGQAFPNYCNEWKDGGPIIEREGIGVNPAPGIRPVGAAWLAEYPCSPESMKYRAHGPTPLIAAMRAFVASKLGDEVDVPEKLK